MITINDLRITVQSYTPYDTGRMYLDGIRFVDNPNSLTVTYDVGAVPYIWYQEKGFRHYITGQMVEVNKKFIENDTVNALDYLANTASARDKSFIMATNKRTVQARNSQISQGLLESIKGRGDSDTIG